MSFDHLLPQDLRLIGVIILAAIATYLTRIGGAIMIARMEKIPPRMEAALNAVPAAVLSTLVAPAIVFGGMDVTIAILVAFVVGLRLSALPMLLAGWAVVMLLRSAGLF
ncbi:hypothetical protein ASG25_12760 [Rhizobium sp. Leaf384]|uniref:AzlD family protein n=1 Tax=unclassified Rhizobium TaxID=2613769 RepID=UPI00071461FD|nr:MULTISPECIES: AzlD family protein [unclassified Rhizobium]KQS79397.1 hypothetical protein ASG25_12760 [Rhizobium sp. Leaf384]KQS85038.1 hypothetical protein ASG58_19450 [Rhizobium sp. Leaf383]